MLASAEVRRRWRGLVVLALVVGVVGAVVLATVAGARRSETSLRRFNMWSRSADVQFQVGSLTAPTRGQVVALGRAQGVASFAALHVFAMQFPGLPNVNGAAAVDANFGTVVDRARVIAGRAVNPSAVDEITIGESLAAKLHLGVGGSLAARSYSSAQVAAYADGMLLGPPMGPRLRFRVVGIVRRPLDLGNTSAAGGVLTETIAFNRHYSGRIGSFATLFRIRTQHADDVPHVVAAAKQIFAGALFVRVTPIATENNGAQDAIDVLSAALWVFAGLVAVAGGAAVAIVLSREISLASVDQGVLRSLGLTRRQRATIVGCPALIVAGAGLLLAVLGAIAMSPLYPIGVARRADPDPGLHVDGLVVTVGVVAIAAFIVAIALFAALRSTRRSAVEPETATRRPSSIVTRAAGAGATPSVTHGLRMALEPGRGRTAVPVRSAYLGAVLGIAGLAAVLIFSANIEHLAATPRLYGWTADLAATDNNPSGNTCGRSAYDLTHLSAVSAVAAVCTQPVQLDGHPVTGFSFASLHGTIQPEVITGRAPNNADEVALGLVTLHDINKQIGDTVQASGPHTTHRYRIVGQVAFPGLVPKQPLADGATFTDAGLTHIFDTNSANRYLLIRFAPGVDQLAIEHHIAANPNLTSLTRPNIPPEVDRLRHINWFPPTLAALLAALALLAVGYTLITSVGRRRHDLALLKTLGFNRRQVRATIAWQATTIATIGVIIGLPTGLALGALIWRPVANSVGVSTTATIPALALLLTIPGALLAANLLAYLPARAAAQTRPAIALRTE
jgi:ABC-type lipoprotein release transport system permease subunit